MPISLKYSDCLDKVANPLPEKSQVIFFFFSPINFLNSSYQLNFVTKFFSIKTALAYFKICLFKQSVLLF